MFTLHMGDGSVRGPMTAAQLNALLEQGIMGCGGAGRIETINVNGVAVAWDTFKAIYNASLEGLYNDEPCECGNCEACGERLWQEWEADHFGCYVDSNVA